MDKQQGHEIQHETDMQQGHTAWTSIMDTQHRHRAWTRSMYMLYRHAVWRSSMDMQQGQAT
jgi:hypothetical protein